MPRVALATVLQTTTASLVAERQAHLDAVAEIDALFAKFGVQPGAARRGPKPGKPGKRGRKPGKVSGKRRVFAQTAEQFIVGLVQGKPLATAQINQAWAKAGRAGVANVVLFHLTKKKKVQRTKIEGGKGNMYSIAK